MKRMLLVMIASCAHAPKTTPSAAKLVKVEYFALGGVGYGGQRSEGEMLTLAIAKPEAVPRFRRMLHDNNHAARLYAYWALRTLDPRFAATQRPTGATLVHMLDGCIGQDATIREIVHEIDHERAMPKP